MHSKCHPYSLELICSKRKHCHACRTKARTRAAIGFPEKCPEGFTAENHPPPPAVGAASVER